MMTENKTNQTSGNRVAALRTLAFLILGYFSFIIAGIMLLSTFFSFTGLPSKADEPWIFLLLQSALYLGFALTVVPHAWYLYHGVQRRRNLEGPDAGVGVIAPTVAGYIVLVLGPFFGFYASIIRFDSLSTSFIISLLELGTIIPLLFPLLGLTYIFLFYLFIVRKKNDEPPGDKTQTSQNEMDTTKEENPSIDNKVVAFKLLVFGYGLLLAGPLIGYVVRGGTSNTLPASHAFYLGASIMVFSQVWFLLVGEHRKPPEDEESKNTLMKYVAAPVLLGYAVLFLIPVLGFVPFAEAYRYAFAVFRNLLVPVLFFVGPIYAALFYVYKMA